MGMRQRNSRAGQRPIFLEAYQRGGESTARTLIAINHDTDIIMAGIGEYMINHHKECDEVFARAEEAAGAGDWPRTEREFEAFAHQMDRHFEIEENLLFPAFEQKTGHTGGPTHVMRMEHDQMRTVIHEMRSAMEAKDAEQYLGLSETFLVLTQQHNFKEEGILYNMMDQVLADEAQALLAQAESVA